MDINATIVVQGVHFYLAYILLKKLFFVPVIALIQKERDYRKLLQNQIRVNQEDVHASEQEKKHQWHIYQQAFAQTIPDLENKDLFVFKGLAPSIKLPEFDENRLKKIEHTFYRACMRKVRRVH